jgi:predicted ester cyclase
MSLEDNKAIVRTFLEKSNILEKTLLELCASSFTAHIGGSPAMDLQTFQQHQAKYFAGFSGSRITIEDMVAEGGRVASASAHAAEFMGIPASGKQIVVPVIGFAQLSAGKIIEWWNSPDRLSWMQQIGALPDLGKTSR